MTDFPERQTAKAAGWSRRTAAFSFVLLLTVWVGHHYGLVETRGYLWVMAVVALLAALALILAAFAFARMWNFGDRGGRDLTIGSLIALAVLSPFGLVAYWLTAYPPLKDISTDLDNPLALDVSDRSADMNRVVPLTPGEQRLQADSYPLVTTHRYDLPFSDVADVARTVIERQGWKLKQPFPVIDEATTDVTVQALAATLGLDLPVDVAVRIEADTDSTLVDMRSASRYGRHDLGENATRIANFLAELDAEMTARVGVLN